MDAGTQTGHYRIVRRLGKGGMGEVYLAADTRLDRDVAIKVLPDELRRDPERLSRFRREAQAAARLKHPNIATIHALEEFDDELLITMEHVEGESLKSLIPPEGMELSTFFDTFIPLADALAHAHEQGRIHRDLKPDNVMIAADGTPKILDFGLARIISTDPSPSEPEQASRVASDSVSDAPTRMHERKSVGTARDGVPSLTRGGQLIGTPQYMSPEQAEGEATDARTDLFSFGVVMYEAVTGHRPFEGKSLESVIGRIMEAEPTSVTTLKPETPYSLGLLIRRCLRKPRDERLQSARELLADLQDIRQELAAGTVLIDQNSAGARVEAATSGSRTLWWMAAGALVLAGISGLVGRISAPTPERTVRRFELSAERLPTGLGALISGPAISPDGKRVAYIDEGSLWIRDLDRVQPSFIEDTLGAYNPFWSPDGSVVGYFKGQGEAVNSQRNALWKVSVNRGSNVKVCELPFGLVIRAAWGGTGEIALALRAGNITNLLSVSERGGVPAVVFDGESRGADPSLVHPFYVQDSRTLLNAYRDETGLHLEVRDADGTRDVGIASDNIGQFPTYAPSGHLLFNRRNADGQPDDVWATPFSIASMAVTGPSFLVAQNATHASVSSDGTLVYQVDDSEPIEAQQLVWVDRFGSLQETIGQPQFRIRNPVLSPDERRVAVRGDEKVIGNGDIWLHEVNRPIKMRLTSFDGFDEEPSWSPDGTQIVWASEEILAMSVDAPGSPRKLVDHGSYPSFSPDGAYLVYHAGTTAASSTSRDIWYLPLAEANAAPVPYLQTDFEEGVPVLSPDGRYLAYVSNESGSFEIYVQRFPGGGDKRQVSVDGGVFPRWNGAGDELFFVADNTLMAARVETRDGLRVGTPTSLFDGESIDVTLNTKVNLRTSFDVTRNGQRFVVVQDIKGENAASIVVVENWYEAFRNQE